MRFDLRPNCSLTPESARWFVGGLAAITFGIAGSFALQGFWPILFFAGLVFPRHWASVKLLAPRARPHPSRLVIELHGRRCEVGRFLNEDERRALAARLGRLVGRINESPTLTP